MKHFIKIENLYKLFGNNTTTALSLVKKGVSKDQVLEETNCVLGLNNVNLSIPKGKIHVIMGLSGSASVVDVPSGAMPVTSPKYLSESLVSCNAPTAAL